MGTFRDNWNAYLILGVVALMFVFAIRGLIRKKKTTGTLFGCGASCSACAHRDTCQSSKKNK